MLETDETKDFAPVATAIVLWLSVRQWKTWDRSRCCTTEGWGVPQSGKRPVGSAWARLPSPVGMERTGTRRPLRGGCANLPGWCRIGVHDADSVNQAVIYGEQVREMNV